jgi:hypothetical protein
MWKKSKLHNNVLTLLLFVQKNGGRKSDHLSIGVYKVHVWKTILEIGTELFWGWKYKNRNTRNDFHL